MSETTPQSRNAAIVVAILTLGGIMAGLIVPDFISPTHVEYGGWPAGSTGEGRLCVTGTVWIEDGPRQVGGLPLVAEGSPPYCLYRACYDPGDAAIEAFGAVGSPGGMDPLFAESEEAWQEGWPPLAVWCGGDDEGRPAGCACRRVDDGAGACEALTADLFGGETWGPAGLGVTIQRGAWRGPCHPAPCAVLAGRAWFPDECGGVPPPSPAPQPPPDAPPDAPADAPP